LAGFLATFFLAAFFLATALPPMIDMERRGEHAWPFGPRLSGIVPDYRETNLNSPKLQHEAVNSQRVIRSQPH
jgi:hypothetical protein